MPSALIIQVTELGCISEYITQTHANISRIEDFPNRLFRQIALVQYWLILCYRIESIRQYRIYTIDITVCSKRYLINI